MKNLAVLLVVLVLVAVNASHAQPLTHATSDAYRDCIAGQCQPVGQIVVAQMNFEANLPEFDLRSYTGEVT